MTPARVELTDTGTILVTFDDNRQSEYLIDGKGQAQLGVTTKFLVPAGDNAAMGHRVSVFVGDHVALDCQVKCPHEGTG